MKIISYEERVAKMQVPGDEETQITRAEQYVANLRRKQRKADTLSAKLEYSAAIKQADTVLRQLRLNVFDLEDMLIKKVEGVADKPSPDQTHQVTLDGKVVMSGDQSSLHVVFNNLSGLNFAPERKPLVQHGEYTNYLREMSGMFGVPKWSGQLAFGAVGQAPIATHSF